MDAATPRPERLGQYETVQTLALGLKWRTLKGFDPIIAQLLEALDHAHNQGVLA